VAEEAAGPLAQFLTWRLHRVNKLTDRATGDAYAEAFGLPVSEARCLAAMGHATALSVAELAALANLDKAQASRAAQALVARGLLQKKPSAVDARAVELQPTPAGRRLWARVMDLIALRNEQIFGCLSAAERRQLASLLDRVIDHAQG
jgi:DNA-binding MarR family transcriptional regulator